MKWLKIAFLSLLPLNFWSSYASDNITDLSWMSITPKKDWQSEDQILYPARKNDLEWHKSQKDNLENIYKDAEKHNVATFRIRISYGEGQNKFEFEKDFCNYIFISGGNTKLRDQIKQKHPKMEFESINNYCPPEPNKPNDYTLRNKITSFFDFREKITDDEKDNIKDVIRSCLENPSLFEEFKLSQKGIEKLLKVTRSALDGRLFNDESNDHAHDLGLVNKSSHKKDKSFEHVDELFGENLQANFADSEQTIRFFIEKKAAEKVSNNNDGWWKPFLDQAEKLGFYKILDNIADDCKTCANLEDRKKKTERNELSKENEEAYQNINLQVSSIIKKINITIDIASYYTMCKNCQATFGYDINKKRQLQKGIFARLLREVPKGISDNIETARNYLISALNRDINNDIAFLAKPCVSLLVSGISKYE